MRIIGFLYGVASYGAFLISFLYAIGFVGNLLVPKSIDSGPTGPLGETFFVNFALLGLFAVQHSAMARPRFKTWWAKIVPPSVERSTYVLISSALLALLFWQWKAMTGSIWSVENRLVEISLNALFWLGWLIALWSTFMISHFDLFGLRQVYLRLRGVAYTPVGFNASALYQYVRHPLMLGFLIAFWATPQMTLGHLLFSLAMTAYIFTGIYFEERDLAAAHGDAFEQYRKEVPMIIPIPGRKSDRARTP